MDWSVVIIILNLVVLESLLSVDNAAVLAVMVSGLPAHQRRKALRYGIIGAYVFRGACLLVASWMMQVVYLKIAGGLYLLWLAYKGFRGEQEGDGKQYKRRSFWGTVFMVEMMDIAFSIDNVFAAVAMSDKFWVVFVGVCIGILAMRFVAGSFVSLMEKYPSLERSAYIVILLLGIKLIFDGTIYYVRTPISLAVEEVINSHWFDAGFSVLTMVIFFLPLVGRRRA